MRLTAPIYHLKRRAKALARSEGLPLHAALDRVAQAEGVPRWSLLAARHADTRPATALLSRLSPGDLVVLAARPGHGKTLLGLELLSEAAIRGRRATFFTLDEPEAKIRAYLAEITGSGIAADTGNETGGASAPERDAAATHVEILAEDGIEAATITRHLAGSPPGSLAVIDYLQILDQARTTPPLAEQVATLKDFAEETGTILAFISQVDRRFEAAPAPLPGLSDLRLPNPIASDSFAKAVFLHDGALSLQDLRAA